MTKPSFIYTRELFASVRMQLKIILSQILRTSTAYTMCSRESSSGPPYFPSLRIFNALPSPPRVSPYRAAARSYYRINPPFPTEVEGKWFVHWIAHLNVLSNVLVCMRKCILLTTPCYITCWMRPCKKINHSDTAHKNTIIIKLPK